MSCEKTYPITRGLCLFFGLFALLNVASCLMNTSTATNLNMWWLDLTALAVTWGGHSYHFGFALEAAAGIAMVAWAIYPSKHAAQRIITCALTLLLTLAALQNAIVYWKTLGSGALYAAMPISLSAVLTVMFGFITIRIWKGRNAKRGVKPIICTVLIAVCCAALFPLLQIGFFGTTDYRRDADAAVVFGARVYEDGSLSAPLRERMDTAVELYDKGFVSHIIVTGGVEDGTIDEAQAMSDYAVKAGVPSDAILIDRYGDTTLESVNNTITFAHSLGYNTILAVSNFYHIPRIKMLYNLQGVDVLTVPVVGKVMENGTLTDVWREIPAWWYYWFKGSF